MNTWGYKGRWPGGRCDLITLLAMCIDLKSCEERGAAISAARTASGLTHEVAALAGNIVKQTLGDLKARKPMIGPGIALGLQRLSA